LVAISRFKKHFRGDIFLGHDLLPRFLLTAGINPRMI
jgi:hypothetical protein